jgi:hypothetical protein
MSIKFKGQKTIHEVNNNNIIRTKWGTKNKKDRKCSSHTNFGNIKDRTNSSVVSA